MGHRMREVETVRFGVVGCGSASVPACEAIVASPLTELAALYDINRILAEDLSRRFQAPVLESLEGMLANPTVDAVYIAVPHHLLASLTKQVLASGKHAFTEKPLAISLEDIDELVELSNRRQLTLGVFYEMRYAPAHAFTRELIQAGAIGDIIGVQIQTLIDKPLTYWESGYDGRSKNPWRAIKAQAGGGVVLMNTSHLLDALFHITGLKVTSLSAQVGTLVSSVEVEDTASAILHFNNGAMGSLFAGAHVRGAHNDERCSIYGTEGQIRLPDPYGSDPLQIYLNRSTAGFTAGAWHSIPLEPVQVHRRAIEDFARAVCSGQRAPIDAQAARQVLSVMLAIYRSSLEKRAITII